MNNDEIAIFCAELDAACETLDKPYRSATAKSMYVRQLSKYGLKNLLGAISAHLDDPERGMFVPTIAHLQYQIAKAIEQDGRPPSDEAWTIAVRMHDEYATVVVNDDIAEAWGIAREAWPDKNGARMAFRAAYERIVSDARAAAKPVRWFASVGHDVAGREGPLLEAVRKGLLLESSVTHLLLQNKEYDLKAIENAAKTDVAKQAIEKLKSMARLRLNN